MSLILFISKPTWKSLTLTWSFIYMAEFVITPTSVNATLGSTATFSCSATAGHLTWIVNGLSHGFECNLGIIARAAGKVIARAIASAIYACLPWLHINHIVLVFEHSAVQNKWVNHASNCKWVSWTVSLLLATKPMTVGVRSEIRRWNVVQV